MDEENDTVSWGLPEMPISYTPAIVVLSAAAVATVTDLRSFRIHNLLTLPLFGAGLLFHGLTGGGEGLVNSLFGALFGFAVPFLFFLMGGMGAGDVKLMACVGAWLGMPLTYYVVVASACAGGIYAAVLIVLYQPAGKTWMNLKIIWHRFRAALRHLGSDEDVETQVSRPDRRYRLVPFAAMVTVGLLTTLCWVWMRSPALAGP